MNPYLNRAMIRQPEDFFGRRSEVARVLSRIGADPPQSVSLVGERRIGKSSLLFHLSREPVRSRHLGEGGDRLQVAFMDCQQLRRIGVDDFFEVLLGKAPPPRDAPRETEDPFAAFRSRMEKLAQRGERLALLLDEFDAITSNPTFGPDFYSFLRSMANNFPLAYVTSSKTELQRLCFSEEISDSPFFNIFSNLYLRPFREEEAEELIAEPSRREGQPLEPYSRPILEMAGRFPLFLQIACSACFEEAEEDGSIDWEEVKARFMEEAAPHFDYAWEQASRESRALMRNLLEGRQPPSQDSYLCRRLVRSGYLETTGDGSYRIFSPLFAEHIRQGLGSSQHLTAQRPGGAEPGQPLEPGAQVNQYRIVRRAGEGGMGVIYKARDTSLDRPVALKFIRPQAQGGDIPRKRFLQEARSAAALSFENVTSVYELFEHEGQVVMVMEWVEGRSLKEILREEGPVDWRRMTEWMIQACNGLEAAHRHGIVHRDIKSSNLMVTNDEERVKITDFGLAKPRAGPAAQSTSLTQEGSLLGTIDYMSPEQARGEPVDSRGDLFSLGVVYFEGLTGKLPFHRRSAGATLRAIFDEPAPHLSLYEVENAERIDRVLRKLLEKSPEDRHPDASQLRSDLRELLRRRRGLLGWLR